MTLTRMFVGGDWRAAVWGVVSIVMAMAVYYPFARVATSRRGIQAAAPLDFSEEAGRSGEMTT